MPLNFFYDLAQPAEAYSVRSASAAKLANPSPPEQSQPVFRANLRIMIRAADRRSLSQYSQSLRSALNLFGRFKIASKSDSYRLTYFNDRLFKTPGKFYLTAEELASLYHPPHSAAVSFENLNKRLSKTLPAWPDLDQTETDGVVIGVNIHQQKQTPISLTAAERSRHVYIIGGTGSGKTTMLKYAIIQDIEAGRGVGIIDPHGDLAEELLGYIPKKRIKDVIYFNPHDYEHPIGINLLEIPEGLNEYELMRAKDLVAEALVSIFRKIFADDGGGGHRIEYVLRNTIHTALSMEEANFFTIFKLLNDQSFNKKVIYHQLKDENLKNFWTNEMHKAGDYQRVKMQAGVTAKIGRFLFSQAAKNVFERTDNCLNFDEVINDKKIFICNFSKGLLGEDTSRLFGATALAKIQLAILQRAIFSGAARVPFYLYVDEFQNFATRGFIEMLSEARKYK